MWIRLLFLVALILSPIAAFADGAPQCGNASGCGCGGGGEQCGVAPGDRSFDDDTSPDDDTSLDDDASPDDDGSPDDDASPGFGAQLGGIGQGKGGVIAYATPRAENRPGSGILKVGPDLPLVLVMLGIGLFVKAVGGRGSSCD